jgi:hypothetical protein
MPTTTKKVNIAKNKIIKSPKVSKRSSTELSIVPPPEPPKENKVEPADTSGHAWIPPDGLIIGDKKVYAARRNRFFEALTEVPLPSINARPMEDPLKILLPPIPYDHWKQIVSWHRKVVADYNAEAHISHLLTRDNQYLHVPFHQSIRRGAMTVDVNYKSPDNLAIMERLEQEYGVSTGDYHGTTHNHVKSSAFESGVDKNDETHKQGVHFTVGYMDRPVIDIHCRIRVLLNAVFDPETGARRLAASSQYVLVEDYGRVIDIPGWDPDIPLETRKTLSKWHAIHVPDEGHPAEWMDFIDEVAYTSYHNQGNWPQTYGNQGAYGQTNYGHNQSKPPAPSYGKTYDPETWSRKSLNSRASSAQVAAIKGNQGESEESKFLQAMKKRGLGGLLMFLEKALVANMSREDCLDCSIFLTDILPSGFWTLEEMNLRATKHGEKNYPTSPKITENALMIMKAFESNISFSLRNSTILVSGFVQNEGVQYDFGSSCTTPHNRQIIEKYAAKYTTGA